MSNKYSSCRLCADYHPHYSDRSKGLCHGVDDCAHVYFAYTNPKFSCYFDKGPRKTITEQQAEDNWLNKIKKHKEFREHLERVSKIVVYYPNGNKASRKK